MRDLHHHLSSGSSGRFLSRPERDITALIESGQGDPRIVCYVNAHTLYLWLRYPEFRRLFFQPACYFYADGWGGVLFFTWLGWKVNERFTAPDFFDALCHNMAAHREAVYFLGGQQPVLERWVSTIASAHPTLRIAGSTNGYFSSDEAVVEDINRSCADVLVVGMGSDTVYGLPRQEIWADRWRSALNVKLIWCVGALYDNYPRRAKRGGRWYFEWWDRIRQNPIRMIPRYTVDGLCMLAWFIYLALATKQPGSP